MPGIRRTAAVIAWVCVGLAVLAAAAGVALHLPPVRDAVWSWAVARVEGAAGIRLEAARLDYNLLTFTARLSDLSVSAVGSPGVPFFEAARLNVTLDDAVLGGALRFVAIDVTDGRLTVIQNADGTSNLPGGSRGDGPPAALAIDRLTLDGLAVTIDGPDLSIDVPRLDAELTVTTGSLALAAPATLTIRGTQTVVDAFEGEAAFDGRSLRLRGLRVTTDDVRATLDGRVNLLVAEPSLALDVEATGELNRLVRWGGLAGDEAPEGTVTIAAEMSGPLTTPTVAIAASVPRLTWRAAVADDVRADARVDATGLDVETLTLTAAGGAVRASGGVGFGALARMDLEAAWEGVDASALLAQLAPAATLPVAGRLDGTARLAGPVGTVEAWDGEAALEVASPVSGGGLTLPGTARLTLDGGAWRVTAGHRVAGDVPVDVALDGTLVPDAWTTSPVRGTIEVPGATLDALARALAAAGAIATLDTAGVTGDFAAVARIDGTLGAPLVDAEGEFTSVEGPELTAGRVVLGATGTPSAAGPLAFILASERVVAAGQVLTGVDVAGHLAAGVLTLEHVRAAQPDATGRLDLAGTYRLDGGAYDVIGTIDAWRLQTSEALPAAGTLTARVAGAGTLAAPAGEATISLVDAQWAGIDLGTLDAAVEAADGTAAVTATAAAFSVSATGRVDTAAPWNAVVDVRAEGTDLARLADPLDLPVTVTGAVSLEAHAEGALQDWRAATVSAVVSGFDARVNDAVVALSAPADLRYADGRLEVESLAARVGALGLVAEGTLAIDAAATPGAPLTLTADGQAGDLFVLAAALGVADLPAVGADGPVRGALQVAGTAAVPEVTGDVSIGPGLVQFADLPTLTDVRMQARLADGRVALVEAGGTFQGARVAATGDAPLALFGLGAADVSSAPASLSLQVTGVTSRVLAPVLSADALARMAGAADLTVELTSPTLDLADVSGEVRLDRFLMAVSGVAIRQSAPTRIVIDAGLLRVETWDWTGDGAEISVSGTADLDARRVDMATDGTLDLRLLTPFLREAGIAPRGRLRPQLTISGAFDAPDVAGEITLEGGELQIDEPRLLVSDLTLRAVLERPRVEVVALSGQVNGGALTGGGTLTFEPGAGSTGGLQLMIDGMAVEMPDGLRSEVGIDVELRLTGGTGGTPLGGAIEGRVVIARGAYREQMSAIGRLLDALNADEVVEVSEGPTLASRVVLDVALVTEEDLIVDNNYAELLLGADLRVLGTAASPALWGRAEIREGGRLFVGPNTYTITRGTIDFANPSRTVPLFDIVAATRAGGEDIEVTISGTPDDLTIDPVSTSRPDLSRTDVQALLLTGRTFDQLSSANAGSLGVQLASSFSGDVLGQAGRAVGLDTLRLDASAPDQLGAGPGIATVGSLGPGADTTFRLPGDTTTLATETDPTSRLTFGKTLRPNLDLIFSQNLALGNAQTWILDYQPFRRVDLRFVSNDESLRAYSLRHDVVFGEAAAARAGVAPRVEPRVVAVQLAGDLVLPEAEVRAVLELGPGDRFGFPEWLDDRDALLAFYGARGYLTAALDATRVAPEGGVTLTYTIDAGPRTVVRVTGRTLDGDVIEAIEAAWSDAVSDDFLVEEVETLVLTALAREGTFGAGVRVALADEGEVRVLAVAVDGGRRTGGLVPLVTGADPELAGAIASRLEALPLAELSVADPEGLADAVAAYLGTRGHLRATAAVDPVVVDDDASAVLPVRVRPGPVFRLGDVTVEGTGPLAAEEVRAAIPLQPGDLHDTTRTAQARDQVAALYRSEGFLRAGVVAREGVQETAGVVDVTFVVTPGPRQVLREIEIRGNHHLTPDVVIGALRLSLDAPLRADEWLAARIRLFETELFRRVDLTTEPMESQDAGVEPVRAVVEVEEWPALRLRYGFEVAEERSVDNVDGRDLVPGVRADLIRRTVFGRAINVGTTLQLQRREQGGRIFLRTPTLRGLPLESQVVLRNVREEIPNVSLRRYVTGVTWEQRYRISPGILVSYGYDFERNRTLNTDPLPGEPSFDISVNVAKLRANASWDTRNDPSNAFRGHLLTTALEFTPKSLGADISYLRALTQAYWFRPWRNVVLASAARFGAIRALDDQPLIASDRFFAGGARSVRGVVENALGERDVFGDPAGGELLLILNQEVRFPIYRWLQGVAFVDAGNVFRTRADFRFADLTGAGGVGLRFDTPFGLFRVDWGKQIWNAGEDAGARFTFGIGQAF